MGLSHEIAAAKIGQALERASVSFTWSPLAAALATIAQVTLPVVGTVAALWTLAWLWYLSDANARLNEDIDVKIIQEQLQRAATVGAPDLAFVGDSTCLFGVDIPTLRKRHPGKSIENFCTMAWVGPAGYAVQIKELARRGTMPKALVIYLSRGGFHRYPSDEDMTNLVKAGGKSPKKASLSPLNALGYVHENLVAPFIYHPAPRTYALYYGSPKALLREMHGNHGSVTNPNGLRFRSAEVLARYRDVFAVAAPPRAYSFATNEPFDAAMSELSDVLAGVDRERVLLVLAPMGARLDASTLAERGRVARLFADRLKLPARNVIDAPASLPRSFFARDRLHPNRWGAVLLTRRLDEHLPPF